MKTLYHHITDYTSELNLIQKIVVWAMLGWITVCVTALFAANISIVLGL